MEALEMRHAILNLTMALAMAAGCTPPASETEAEAVAAAPRPFEGDQAAYGVELLLGQVQGPRDVAELVEHGPAGVEQQRITMPVFRHKAHSRRAHDTSTRCLQTTGEQSQQLVLSCALHGRDAHNFAGSYLQGGVVYALYAASVTPACCVQ